MNLIKTIASVVFFGVASGVMFTAHAADVAPAYETTITGSQEQPKVIYIVPWQAPQAPAGLNQPISKIIMQDLLTPIDRDTFLRQVEYRNELTQRALAAGKAE